jgi:hypothetical protein
MTAQQPFDPPGLNGPLQINSYSDQAQKPERFHKALLVRPHYEIREILSCKSRLKTFQVSNDRWPKNHAEKFFCKK